MHDRDYAFSCLLQEGGPSSKQSLHIQLQDQKDDLLFSTRTHDELAVACLKNFKGCYPIDSYVSMCGGSFSAQ